VPIVKAVISQWIIEHEGQLTYNRLIGKVAQKPIRQVAQIHVEKLISGKRRDAGSKSPVFEPIALVRVMDSQKPN
jgi:hypothetical protein